ncbi:putative Mannose-binding lectin [Seiridium cardinale]|uniref:Mannose-binding lectin n=1 Tax=Seiridium cardinale TaxID=138064 RepID=A0ABR2XLK2_9PEZI
MKWGSGRRGCLNGIELEFSDGKRSSAGNTDTTQTFEECLLDIVKGERVKSMSLWGMGSGQWDRTSRLRFDTTDGTAFNAGAEAHGENEYKSEVGSGLLVGFRGRAGINIDCLAPLFLKPVVKQYVDKITYPTLDMNDTGFLQMEILDRAKAEWDGVTGKCTIRGERPVSISRNWNNKNTVDFGVQVMFSAGIPFLAKNETTIMMETGY